ncbi:MAG TPA: helix-turn-helix domain-containing protein [Candidatus Binatia bacterium]|jgi:excisionase family DNA binding protein|nr:helix-turn-helix domain-containing protein [Candidatus Binatia bacterium]
MSEEILTLKDVATLLKVAEKTVYRLAQRGEIPCFKVGGQWRCRRRDLEAWIEARSSKSTKRTPPVTLSAEATRPARPQDEAELARRQSSLPDTPSSAICLFDDFELDDRLKVCLLVSR